MATLIRVTPDFAVAPQLTAADLAAAAAEGFKTVIGNRPDGEAPDQMSAAETAAAARANNLKYHAIPFAGPPPQAAVDAMAAALGEAEAPVLAFCRTGTRSITAWALAEVQAGRRTPDDVIALAAKAGYDLGPLRARLTQNAGG